MLISVPFYKNSGPFFLANHFSVTKSFLALPAHLLILLTAKVKEENRKTQIWSFENNKNLVKTKQVQLQPSFVDQLRKPDQN